MNQKTNSAISKYVKFISKQGWLQQKPFTLRARQNTQQQPKATTTNLALPVSDKRTKKGN